MSRADRRAAASIARGKPWTAFERGPLPDIRVYPALDKVISTWKNNHFSVVVFQHVTAWGLVEQLQVQRHDGAPIRSWSDMQRIKDELAGPERVAVEVYPAADEVHDAANAYHLWVLPSGFRLPFSLLPDRRVTAAPLGASI